MARRKVGTCIHAIKVGKFGSVFVKSTCPNPRKIYIKMKNITVIVPAQCERCEMYRAKQKVKEVKKNGSIGQQKVNSRDEKKLVRKVRT